MEIITCDPSVYTMDHPKFIVSNQKDESISVSDKCKTITCLGSCLVHKQSNTSILQVVWRWLWNTGEERV